MSGPLSRRLILGVAASPAVERLVHRVGPALGAYRFVAGDTVAEACAVVRRLAAEGIGVTLDHLGESVRHEAAARAAGAAYLEVLDRLADEGLTAHVSIKLTQMGLDLSADLCREVVLPILDRVDRLGSFCRIDMEDSAHTDLTLDLWQEFFSRTRRVGIVLQAYLYRTGEDLRRVSAQGPAVNVRIVKGAYLEPPDRAFAAKSDVDRRYVELVQESLRLGNFTAVATHDLRIIDQVLAHVRREGIGRDRYEFQMLYGIRTAKLRQLAHAGEGARVYLPYGPDWYAYFMRRLAERPANLWFFLSNVARR